jgi:hypothetical protein
MEKVKFYLGEVAIVTIGVLIALFFSNLKEKNQARKYQKVSLETVKNEVRANYSDLKNVMEEQTRWLDTINKYNEAHVSIYELISKTKGLQVATLSNTGLEFYTKNQINSIDFKTMSKLIQMNILSELIDKKVEKLTDFLYPNMFVDSRESKFMVDLYMRNVLESERQLMRYYQSFIDENI